MAAPTVRPDVQHFSGATDEEKESVELVAAHALAFERGIGIDAREMFNKRYKQYRSFSHFKADWVQAGPNDRDGVLIDAKRKWGANLHIPLSFRTIETMVPRAVAHRPRMLYLPRQERWEENTASVRHLIDAQQEQIDIDLPFQAIMRSGRIYGLGAGKAFWLKEYAAHREVKPRSFRPGSFYLSKLKERCTFDDPFYEDIDIFDLMWDPYGSDVRSCGWMLHRNWLSLEGVLHRVKMGAWDTPSAQAIGEEDLRTMGGRQEYDAIWQERMEASGFARYQTEATVSGEQIHEVWEWHDGHRVLTVLDRQVLVQDAENPCVGRLPFQVYRPTPLQKQMVGIGDLEPLEHLQRELDTLRSQRRDAATLALAAGYAFDGNAIDEEDLEFGPFAAIEVRNQSPRDAIMPLQRQEPPGTSYEEERVIRQDFDLVPGLSDALDPSSGGNVSTATEAQLMQAALSRRIELGSRRFEIEIVRHAARCFLHLNQRMILAPRDPVRLPDQGMDVLQAAEEGRWKWFPIDPGSLRGEFEIIPEGGSMAARNVQQDRQDAIQMMNVFGQNPYIDPKRPLRKALQLFGVEDPDAWLRQQDPPVPPRALQIIQEMGFDPRLLQHAIAQAQQEDPMLNPEQQGPQAADLEQMGGMAA